MNTIIYNEMENSTLGLFDTSWSADFDPSADEGTISVRRFGDSLSLLSIHYNYGGTKSILIYDGRYIDQWESDEDEVSAPLQAISELYDRNSVFYRNYISTRISPIYGRKAADHIYALVTGKEK